MVTVPQPSNGSMNTSRLRPPPRQTPRAARSRAASTLQTRICGGAGVHRPQYGRSRPLGLTRAPRTLCPGPHMPAAEDLVMQMRVPSGRAWHGHPQDSPHPARPAALPPLAGSSSLSYSRWLLRPQQASGRRV